MPPNHRLPNDAQLLDPLCCPAISSLCGHTIRSVHLPCSNQASLPRNCSGASARFRTASDPNLQPFAFRSPMSPNHRLLNAGQPSAPLCCPAISSPMPSQCPRRPSPLLYSSLAFPKLLWCFREISDCLRPYSTLTSASEATLNVLYIHYYTANLTVK